MSENTFETQLLTLETHPSFGQMFYAPADGRVVKVVNDRPVMKTGERDTEQIVGNQVVIEIGEGRYFLMPISWKAA